MAASKTPRTVGWVLSILLALFLIGGSAVGKFAEWDGKEEMFNKLGFKNDLIQKIGILEIVITLIFLIPRTGFIGAILLTGYLGGAICTHVRIGDAFIFPIILGVVMWIALGLRQPTIFQAAKGN